MRFVKIVFWIAGALGLLASVGLYFQSGSYVYYGLIAGVLFVIAYFKTPKREKVT